MSVRWEHKDASAASPVPTASGAAAQPSAVLVVTPIVNCGTADPPKAVDLCVTFDRAGTNVAPVVGQLVRARDTVGKVYPADRTAGTPAFAPATIRAGMEA